MALAGFCLFYGLERLAAHHGAHRPDYRGTEGREPATATVQVEEGASSPYGVFWLHLGSFALYNAVITYTLPSTYRTGVAFAVLFSIAMGLHFLLSDRGLEERYGSVFDRWTPRLLLSGALISGWILAALLAPTRSVTVSLLMAFLAGSVLLNVFKEEIPEGRNSSFAWFLVGLAAYSVLLLAVTALE